MYNWIRGESRWVLRDENPLEARKSQPALLRDHPSIGLAISWGFYVALRMGSLKFPVKVYGGKPTKTGPFKAVQFNPQRCLVDRKM